MPRARQKDVHLPQHVYFKHGAYFFVDKAKKWHRVGTTDGEMYRNLAALLDAEHVPNYPHPKAGSVDNTLKSPISAEARLRFKEHGRDGDDHDEWCLRYDICNRVCEIVDKHRQGVYERDSTFVYVIGSLGLEMPVKIGYSGDITRRMRDLQNSSAVDVELRAAYLFESTEIAHNVEKLAHLKYWKARIRGEWFNVRAADVSSWLEDICSPLKPVKHKC